MKVLTTALCLTLSLLVAGCNKSADTEKAKQEYIERSTTYERQGQYRAAMIEMRNAIQASPDDIDLQIRYAETLIKIGGAQQAINLLASIDDSYAKVALADAYLNVGKFISASEAVEEADSDSYRYEDLPVINARILYLQGKTDEAINTLRSHTQTDASSLRSKKVLIELLIQDRKIDEASRWVSQLRAAYEDDSDLMFYAAQLAYTKGDYEESEQLLTSALVELPEADILIGQRLKALQLLSETLTKLGRPSEALVYNKIIQQANPEGFSAQQQYKDALSAAAAGDLASAKGAFEDILSQFPNNQQAALLLGLITLEEGNITEGESLLSENIDAETAPIPLIQATALAQAEVGKIEEALNVIERALLARPDDPTLLALHGIISLNSNNAAKGIESISKALQLDPDRSRLHLLLAQHYNQDNKPELALGHLRKAFASSPDDWATTSYYISALFEANEQAEIEQVRQSLLKNDSNDPTPGWLAASIDFRNGELLRAKNALANLYQSHNENNRVTTLYATALERSEEYSFAADVWLTALSNEPNNPQYLERAVRAKSQSSNPNGIITWLNSKKSSLPDAALPINAGLVQLYLREDNLEAALNIANQYQTSQEPLANSLRASAYRALAIRQAQAENFKEALSSAEQAIAAQPANPELTILAAQLELRNSNESSAEKRLETFINAYDNNALAINELAKVKTRTQGEQAAYNYLQPYWNQEPKGEYAELFLALTKEVISSRYEDTVDELLEVEPENPAGNLIKGDLLLARGDYSKAIQYYQTAIEENPNSVLALNNYAWLLAQENPDEALQFSSRAVELAPNNGAILDTHGWILHLSGDNREAKDVLTKALELLPDNAEIQEHLATVSAQ
jgi:putative PEP-CTERM system TPR-repeat lipoprotein